MIVGGRQIKQNGVTHVLEDGAAATMCGNKLARHVSEVAGAEVSCARCAELAGMPHEREKGRFWTSSKYGRVTLAQFERQENAGFFKKSWLSW